MKRTPLAIAILVASAVLVGSAALAGSSSRTVRNGGTFRVTTFAGAFDSVDPALAYIPLTWSLLDATCARLFYYPDRPPPQGFRAVPEVAAGYPRITHNGRTFTFKLRSGLRFSNGAPVKASAFARQINRMLNPAMHSPGLQYVQDIVGASDVLARRRASARGVVAKGMKLVVSFTRAVPDFPAWTTMPFFCAVPPGLPADAEGVATYAGAGPYYVAQQVRGRSVVLKRNPFYRGSRPRHVDRFVVDFAASSFDEVLDRIEAGKADGGFAPPPFYFAAGRRLAQKYGVNRSQFFLEPGLTLKAFALNTSRPLFRNNPKLRRAVNFAADRAALQRAGGGRLSGQLTDQYLPSGIPGFRNASVYPLSRPNLKRAKRLAVGHRRTGKAILYIIDDPAELPVGQILKQDLAKIGLAVEIKAIPASAYFGRVGTRGESFDIAWMNWLADYIDPYTYINSLLEGDLIRRTGNANIAYFDSPRFNSRMNAAARLRGRARFSAYGKLDIELARDAAPIVSYAFAKEPTLVSKRVGCVVLRPGLDFTAVCLK